LNDTGKGGCKAPLSRFHSGSCHYQIMGTRSPSRARSLLTTGTPSIQGLGCEHPVEGVPMLPRKRTGQKGMLGGDGELRGSKSLQAMLVTVDHALGPL
jgi:hypothetical protein